jgi:hypothetical protein
MQPVTEYPSVSKQSIFLVQKIIYDEHGRPVFGDRLGSRPGSTGEQFAVVHAINDRPSRSYEIAIVEQPKTGPGPLAVSIPETAKELKRIVVNTRETLIGYTEYTYDARGRIRFMKLYPPVERAEALVRTEFFYEGEGDVPARTEVTSIAEKKVRVVR